MKKIAIIGGGRMACIFSQNAKEMNIETHCFSPEQGIVDMSAFDFIHPVNILEREKVLEICKEIGIDGVVATTELTVATAAYVAENMQLHGIPFDVASVITDKYRNREATKNVEGLNHPKFAKIHTVDELYSIGFEYPIILKPTSKGGKRGITVIRDRDQIESAFQYAKAESGDCGEFVVEEYIDGGMECSVESLSFEGKHYIVQITEKHTSGAPHCVELAHHQPAPMSEEKRNEVINILCRSFDAIGLNNSTCHTEIKIRNGKVYLIEFNSRPGGDHIAHPLTELSTGFPYIKGAIKVALGEFEGYVEDSSKKRCAGVMFVTEQTKELKPIFDKCQQYDWCFKKNHISDELKSIVHNDGFNNNCFIYCSTEKPNFDELKEN